VHEIDVAALKIACHNLAREVLWSEDGTPEVVVAELAGEFMRLASIQAAGIIELGRDPNIATRAINYLAYTHVGLSGNDAKRWFNEMLICLLELAVPSMIQTSESSAFLRDVQKGIAELTGLAEETDKCDRPAADCRAAE